MSDTPKKKRNFLIIYVITLLAIALVLLLFSFLQSHRSNEQLNDLREEHNIFSTSALQSISDLNSRLGELEEQNSSLQQELSTLSDANARLSETNAVLTAEGDSLRSQLTAARDELAEKRLEMYDQREYLESLVGIFEQMETDGIAELFRDENGQIVSVSIPD